MAKPRYSDFYPKSTIGLMMGVISLISVIGLVFGSFGLYSYVTIEKHLNKKIEHLNRIDSIFRKEITDIYSILDEESGEFFYLTGSDTTFNLTGYPSESVYIINCTSSEIFIPEELEWRGLFIVETVISVEDYSFIVTSGTYIGYIIESVDDEISGPDDDDYLIIACEDTVPGDYVDIRVLNDGYVQVIGGCADYGIDFCSDCC